MSAYLFKDAILLLNEHRRASLERPPPFPPAAARCSSNVNSSLHPRLRVIQTAVAFLGHFCRAT